MLRLAVFLILLTLMGASACGSSPGSEPETRAPAVTSEATSSAADSEATSSDQRHPDVLGAEAEPGADGTWTIRATISSPYDTPQRYADAWRVIGPDGEVLGVRELAHDHAGEQPFTRSLGGVMIPAEVDTVTIEGRDQANGWGGMTFALTLPAG